jgi:ribonuclease P protein component
MIPRKFRLTGKKEIDTIKSKGRLIQSTDFALLYLDSQDRNINPRFGIIVSKKISTKATQRNQVKRKLRYVLMQLVPKIKRGYDLMFLTKTSILNQKTEELEKEISALLIKESIMI